MGDRIEVKMQGIVQELKLVDKKFASAVRKEIRRAVTDAGTDIVGKVRAEASWSKRIPAATTIRPNFTAKSAGVRIVTNRRKAPHARPLEGVGGGRTFTHPLFGNKDDLINQPVRPFFFKAIEKATPATERKFDAAINEALRTAGFR